MRDEARTAAVLTTGLGLVSLWDLMIVFEVGLLLTRLKHLEDLERELRGHMPPEERPLEPQMKAAGQPMWESDAPEAFTTHAGRKWLWAYLGPIQADLMPLNLPASQLEIQHIWNHADRWTRRRLAEGLNALRWKIEQELRNRFFVFLDEAEAAFFREKTPFGEAVASAFPSAAYDVIEAAQCYALNRHTACVFHCMRVLEYGLRTMAEHLGKTFETQNWYNIINEIEGEIRIRASAKKTPEKDEEMRFLSAAAKEFGYFKDGWRNYAMHGRSKYDGSQALSALNHTRDFMNNLATRLKESAS